MKTRLNRAKKASLLAEETASSIIKHQLEPDSTNPPRLFVLPKAISADARLITLKNPRYSTDCRFLVCPQYGIFEFTKISPRKFTPRSWLLSRDVMVDTADGGGESTSDLAHGYVIRDANLFMATQIDPLFFLLPALTPLPSSKASKSQARNFVSFDDHLDNVTAASPALDGFVRSGCLRNRLQTRLAAVCDTVDAGDEKMYRLKEEKFLSEMLSKARTMVKHGLPASMEEKLVRKVLEPPLLSMKRGKSSVSVEEGHVATDSAQPAALVQEDTQESSTSLVTSMSSVSEASTTATSFTSSALSQDVSPEIGLQADKIPGDIADLLRLRIATSFLCSNYLSPHLSSLVKALLASSGSGVDFTPLDTHLAHLAKLRKEAHATRSTSDFSGKRSMNEDEESEIRAEKKRKLEEEEKKKKLGESRGIKQLKKVNVSGMKKMSDFFQKK